MTGAPRRGTGAEGRPGGPEAVPDPIYFIAMSW
jgi:hypothetical protein